MGWFKRSSKATEDNIDTDVAINTDESAPATPSDGPFDQEDHPEQGDLLDAGSLWIPVVPEMELRAALDPSQKTIMGIAYLREGSGMQLEVFAAPRSTGLWDDVRRDILTYIAKQGGSSTESEGPFGMELQAQVPEPQSEQLVPRRLIGIDGPRWLLRITLFGIAAVDKSRADEFLEVAQRVVVVRGNAPHPPRERLSLHVPQVGKKTEE